MRLATARNFFRKLSFSEVPGSNYILDNMGNMDEREISSSSRINQQYPKAEEDEVIKENESFSLFDPKL